MRIPDQAVERPHSRRRGLVALIVAVAIIIAIIIVQGLAGFYTNFLWFHSSGVGDVWSRVIETKVLVAVVFIVVAFAIIWTCLYLVEKVSERAVFLASDTELVRRYQSVIAPHSMAIRGAVSFVLALALGAGTASQWQHWILFTHDVPFGITDPIFHRDVSFFVFRLPFLSFLGNWIFSALIVAFFVTAIGYFLNGAIRLQGATRVEPRALAHLSLILGLMALERAWAFYYIDRPGLELSQNGYVAGAGYTDVHVRLPAMTLLAVVSLVSFAMLTFNAYQRSWVLPAAAVGLWCFLALAIGVIYPAIIQALRVTPAQSTLEKPYIQRNITATRQALGITGSTLSSQAFPANEDLTPGVVSQYSSTLNSTQLWDPTFAMSSFVKLQDKQNFYSLTNLTIDRYKINGQLIPVDVGVRALNSSGLPSTNWVNTHLQFTHGYGAVVAPANTATSGGSPQFDVGNIPETSSVPSLKITQPNVYFAPGDEQYVIADTNQPEVDYRLTNGNEKESSYAGNGGIPIGSFLSRLAFAIHLHDLNLLISSDITSKSRLIYIPDVQAEVQKALPFLQVDSNPYAVVANGQIYWMLDAYTTTSYYPYGEPAQTNELSPGSGLQANYNYVRDAVKVVVNAYTGKMSFYTIDAKSDPIIESYEKAFPGLFQPLSKMQPSILLQHLRYPQDLLMVQSAMYGRYHITNPSAFYSLSNAWDLSSTSTSGTGRPSDPLPTNPYTGLTQPFAPIYELLQLPGESGLSFNAIEPLVPYSSSGANTGRLQTLSALLVADSSVTGYGKLTAYVTPSSGSPIDGPGLANADINANQAISKQLTLLDSGGSTVALGTVQVLPIADSLIYVRPLYVSSTESAFPLLQDVIVVYGSQVAMEPTLGAALADVFGASVAQKTGTSGSSTGTVPTEVRTLLSEANAQYKAAQAALAQSNLGTYQSDVTAAGQLLNQATQLLAAANPTSTKKISTKTPAKAAATTSTTTSPNA